MITRKNSGQIALMRRAGKVVAEMHEVCIRAAKPFLIHCNHLIDTRKYRLGSFFFFNSFGLRYRQCRHLHGIR